MEFQAFKQAVIAAAAARGVAEYELYYQTAESTSVEVFRDQVNDFTAAVDGGVCLRCVVNGKMGYASTEELSEAAAQALVRLVVGHELAHAKRHDGCHLRVLHA